MTDKVKVYFETYPDSNECFESADGFLFHDKNKAEAHGATLNDRTVQKHERKTPARPPADKAATEPTPAAAEGHDRGTPDSAQAEAEAQQNRRGRPRSS
jgi:hypothetical protein